MEFRLGKHLSVDALGKYLAVAVVAGLLAFAATAPLASAQTQPPPAPPAGTSPPTGPAPPTGMRTVTITLEQRHVIRELIGDAKAPRAAISSELAAGETVPPDVELRPIPALIGEKVPQIKAHRFFLTEKQIVLVDPQEDRIANVID